METVLGAPDHRKKAFLLGRGAQDQVQLGDRHLLYHHRLSCQDRCSLPGLEVLLTASPKAVSSKGFCILQIALNVVLVLVPPQKGLAKPCRIEGGFFQLPCSMTHEGLLLP